MNSNYKSYKQQLFLSLFKKKLKQTIKLNLLTLFRISIQTIPLLPSGSSLFKEFLFTRNDRWLFFCSYSYYFSIILSGRTYYWLKLDWKRVCYILTGWCWYSEGILEVSCCLDLSHLPLIHWCPPISWTEEIANNPSWAVGERRDKSRSLLISLFIKNSVSK